MPLLRDGQIINQDNWVVVGDESNLPERTASVLVSLTRFIELRELQASDVTTSEELIAEGVLLTPTDDVHLLSPYLGKLKLVGIEFPVFTDGRGYTQARLLRKRLGYDGEIRAFGDIREDQLLFMLRTGINSFEFADLPDQNLIETLVTRFSTNYQPSYGRPT